MIYLYIKTHNVTGLKYLGKTTRDPYKYKGSGKRWTNHINKHGNDVTTEIIGSFNTNEELKQFSEKLSEELDVVNSNDWANLMPETGAGGNTSKYIDYTSINHGKGQTYEERYGIEKALELKQLRSKKLSETRKGKTYKQIHGDERAEILRKKRSEDRSKYNTGRTHSRSTREKISQRAVGRIQTRCSCIICHTEISINNISSHYKVHPSLEKSLK
jgi:hypothetical protein